MPSDSDDAQQSYFLPAPEVTVSAEVEIKRSRFIAHVARVRTEDQARAFIERIRGDFPDARHHCSAYYYLVPHASAVERSSDDGEPSGTAGKPILDVIRGSGMADLACVVVRYFGGTKLGAGGLVHAYSQAASDAVDAVTRVKRSLRKLYKVSFSHAIAQKMEAELRARQITIADTHYGSQVTYTLAIAPNDVDGVISQIAALTSGDSELEPSGTAWVERTVE